MQNESFFSFLRWILRSGRAARQGHKHRDYGSEMDCQDEIKLMSRKETQDRMSWTWSHDENGTLNASFKVEVQKFAFFSVS